jgi:hypothetical protein
MKVDLRFVDSNTDIDFLLPYLREAEKDDHPSAKNMAVDGWENNRSSLLYLIYKEKRYDPEGCWYSVGMYDDKIFASGGISRLHDSNIGIIGSRGFTLKEHRQHAKYYHWAATRCFWDTCKIYYDGYVLCYNEHNKKKAYVSTKINENYVMDSYGYPVHKNNLERAMLPVKMYPEPVLINYTKQYVVYGSCQDDAKVKEYLDTIVYE